MKLVVVFDLDADIIDVPQSVINNKDVLRKKFLSWLYNKNNGCYRKSCATYKGKRIKGVCYRSDAFVEWLNKKVINQEEKASVLIQNTNDYPDDLPQILF